MWGTRADFLTLVVIWELNQQNKELSPYHSAFDFFKKDLLEDDTGAVG